MQGFHAEKVSENVYWVGAVDYNVRSFHGYRTSEGTTYNAFLVIDDKITLIDTVKKPFFDEMMARIASVIEPEKIDYIISNHAEPDHSGALQQTIAAVKPEKVFASVLGVRNLNALYGADLALSPLKTGDELAVGKGKIKFIETKMLHWPDSMFSYYDRDGVLFSQDALGMHLAGSKLWADENDRASMEYEVRKYFANILLHLSGKVLDLLNSLPQLGLDLKVVAPDHGPLYRRVEDLAWIIGLTKECAEQKFKKRAVIFYSTMWGATDKLARSLCDGIRSSGVPVDLISLEATDRSDVITKVLASGIVAAGTPTINNNMYPKMADVLCYLKGLRPQNHIGYAFGAFGWSGEGHKQVHQLLTEVGFEMSLPPFAVKFAPTDADRETIFNQGKQLGEQLLSKIEGEEK